MIKLVACRLESLLDPNGSLDLDSLQLRLIEMRHHHAQMVLMSRASYPYLLTKFQSLSNPVDYVAENGAEVVINGVNVKEYLFNAKLLSQILDWLNQQAKFREATITLSSRARTMTNATPKEPIYSSLKRMYPTMKSVPDLLMVASQIYQIRIDLKQKNTEPYQALLKNHFHDQIRLINGKPGVFYLVSPEANFANGLATIQKKLGIRNRQTAAFGKFESDFGYVNAAKYSFAPQDAAQNVKDVSQALAGSGPVVIMRQIDRLMKQK